MGKLIQGEIVIPGEFEGELLVSTAPLSFWGGYDQYTGEIIDRRHPLSGKIAANKILAIPFTIGSSTTTAILLEAIRVGKAPSAIITTTRDHFMSLASIVADELYKKPIPIIKISEEDFSNLKNGQTLKISKESTIEISDPI